MDNINISNSDINVETLIDNTMEVQLLIDDTANVDVELLEDTNEIEIYTNENQEIKASIDTAVTNISTIKHDELQNKDLPNQHKISSITGLQDELNTLNQFVNRNTHEIAELRKQIEEDECLAMPYVSKDTPDITKTNIWFDISNSTEIINEISLALEIDLEETIIDDNEQLITE